MTWMTLYRGDGEERDVDLPPAPPWRRFPAPATTADGRGLFQPPAGLVDAVNAALSLRRPLLITGPPGAGKSSVVEAVAREVKLGPVLRWPISSRSNLTDALYLYDALGRLYAHQSDENEDIGRFLRLGPLGTALLPSPRPRALLIDEIDKSDIDLPSDLLNVLERGEFEIPELNRLDQSEVSIREWDSDEVHTIVRGRVQCQEFPFVVMTSNSEREFPAPFLRRTIRFDMPPPDVALVTRIVEAHLGTEAASMADRLVAEFVARVRGRQNLATDQLLNALFIVSGELFPDSETRERLVKLVLRDLSVP